MSDDVDEALARARRHLTRASLEASEAVGAILEATGRASGLDPAQTEALAQSVARHFEAQLDRLRAGQLLPSALVTPLEEALAREIERWEARSQRDPNARAVLRAFLGLRELLWELGLRREDEDAGQEEAPPPPKRPRVQRFDVEE